MSNQWLTIKQLDRLLKEWREISIKYPRPRTGWVKTLRTALCMSAEQLANRLGLSRFRIIQLEKAEIHDGVTLRSMKEVADAMGCEFVYAIVPKNLYSLEEIIKTRAEQVATERVNRVAHSMSLEAQSVNKEILNQQKNELAKNLADHLTKKIWADLETPDTSTTTKNSPTRKQHNNKKTRHNDLIKKLIKTQNKKK